MKLIQYKVLQEMMHVAQAQICNEWFTKPLCWPNVQYCHTVS